MTLNNNPVSVARHWGSSVRAVRPVLQGGNFFPYSHRRLALPRRPNKLWTMDNEDEL